MKRRSGQKCFVEMESRRNGRSSKWKVAVMRGRRNGKS